MPRPRKKLRTENTAQSWKNQLDDIEAAIESGTFTYDVTKERGLIHVAAECNKKAIVEYLLNNGVDVDERTGYNSTALHYAVRRYSLDIIEYLIKRGANVAAKNRFGVQPIHLASKAVCGPAFIPFLLGQKIYNNDTDDKGWTVLHYAAKSRNCLTTTYLLKSPSHKVLSFLSLKNWHMEQDGLSTKNYADNPTIGQRVRSILDQLDPNSKDKVQGSDPLMTLLENNIGAVERLMESKVDINKQGKGGVTALHLACLHGKLGTAECLVDSGARCDLKDDKGHTALYYYIHRIRSTPEHYYHKLILDNIGNDIVDNNMMTTAAHVACSSTIGWGWIPDWILVKLVIQNQKDLNAENIDGKTPLNCFMSMYLSVSNKRSSGIIRLFIQRGAYLKVSDCQEIVGRQSLKEDLFADVTLCTRAVANKFNNRDLPVLFTLSRATRLPPILDLTLDPKTIRAIEIAVQAEISDHGYCDVSKIKPVSLLMLCVNAYLLHFDKVCP